MKKLIENNPNYGNNFVFTVIESFFNRDGSAPYILERETYWKKVFATRAFGNNSGPIFFIIFMVNFLLYLSLFMIRLTGKDPVKKLFLGYAGIVINSFNTISLFSLLFSFDDISDIIFIFITFELIGFFVVYAAWIYACKNHETKENGSLIKNKYLFFSIIELFFFMLPLAILIGILFFASNRSSANKNMKNSEPNTQFILSKDYNTITIDNKTYLVKNNKLLDFRTNKEVGYLDKDKVILKTKDD